MGRSTQIPSTGTQSLLAHKLLRLALPFLS